MAVEALVVSISSVLFILALDQFRRVYLLSRSEKKNFRWLLLGAMVLGFITGYLTFIGHLFSASKITQADQMVTVIFAGGSIFVLACAHLFHSTTRDLISTLEKIEEQSAQLNLQKRALSRAVDTKTHDLFRERVRLAEETSRSEMLERQRLEARLVANQRLESIELMASGIAHDFNNLLVGILGNASYAKQLGPGEGIEFTEALTDVEDAAERAADLTRQLTAYCGKTPSFLEAVDISIFVTETLFMMRSSLDAKVSVVRELESGLPLVWGDSARFRQLVMNLVKNGFEAMLPGSGTLFIRTGSQEVGESEASEDWFEDSILPGSYVFLEIEDQGCGIAESEQKRVFEPFFSTKGLGRGLGLAAVEGIVRSHNGGVLFSSIEGQGTKIRSIFPVLSDNVDIAVAGPSLSKGSKRGNKLLAIDDELIVLDTIRRGMEREGYRVDTASRESEFLELLEGVDLDYCAAIVDIMMPDIVFEEMFVALRARLPNLPILVSSGYSNANIEDILGDDPLVGFLTKPYRVNALVEAINNFGAALTK